MQDKTPRHGEVGGGKLEVGGGRSLLCQKDLNKEVAEVTEEKQRPLIPPVHPPAFPPHRDCAWGQYPIIPRFAGLRRTTCPHHFVK